MTKPKQHVKPCSECPWRRTAPRGWLGLGLKPEYYIEGAHGEAWIHCHMTAAHQCAGAAIYRSNVCKEPRNKTYLRLPRDHKTIFSSATEFLKHHTP